MPSLWKRRMSQLSPRSSREAGGVPSTVRPRRSARVRGERAVELPVDGPVEVVAVVDGDVRHADGGRPGGGCRPQAAAVVGTERWDGKQGHGEFQVASSQ